MPAHKSGSPDGGEAGASFFSPVNAKRVHGPFGSIYKTQKYFLPHMPSGMCQLLSLASKFHAHPSLLLCDSRAGLCEVRFSFASHAMLGFASRGRWRGAGGLVKEEEFFCSVSKPALPCTSGPQGYTTPVGWAVPRVPEQPPASFLIVSSARALLPLATVVKSQPRRFSFKRKVSCLFTLPSVPGMEALLCRVLFHTSSKRLPRKQFFKLNFPRLDDCCGFSFFPEPWRLRWVTSKTCVQRPSLSL